VSGPLGRIIVKQALPYVRLVGDSWPLPLNRAFFEYNALTRHAARDPGRVPEVFHFDEGQALIVMRCLSPHVILRKSVVQGVMHPMLARHMGVFLARSLFRGSALSLSGRALRQDMALFAGNHALADITENLVFSDPYFAAKLNRHTPGLAPSSPRCAPTAPCGSPRRRPSMPSCRRQKRWCMAICIRGP
jgi:5-methylthioribose kinase